jgi:hypothetical protein
MCEGDGICCRSVWELIIAAAASMILERLSMSVEALNSGLL